MLGLEFYDKVEKRMNKKYMKTYYGAGIKGYFNIEKVSMSMITNVKDALIYITIKWGIEEHDNTRMHEFIVHNRIKNVKQLCDALYTAMNEYEMRGEDTI